MRLDSPVEGQGGYDRIWMGGVGKRIRESRRTARSVSIIIPIYRMRTGEIEVESFEGSLLDSWDQRGRWRYLAEGLGRRGGIVIFWKRGLLKIEGRWIEGW